MNKITSALCGVLAAAMTATMAVPVAAAPVFVPSVPQASVDVVQVQARESSRMHRRDDRRMNRRDDRPRHGRFERRGNHHYYNNHRGYRERRPGYRQYNGFWFPPAAFIAGAIIGGSMNQNRVPAMRMSHQHVNWCQNRWRSYRVSDNSYQPYNGPRQQCYSPYS